MLMAFWLLIVCLAIMVLTTFIFPEPLKAEAEPLGVRRHINRFHHLIFNFSLNKMNFALQDKIIFLTGGSCGIGRDCAKAYAAEGAKVIIAAIDPDGVEKVTAELGAGHLGIVCDVSRDQEV